MIENKNTGDIFTATDHNAIASEVNKIAALEKVTEVINLEHVDNIIGSVRFNSAHIRNYAYLGNTGKTFQLSRSGEFYSTLKQGHKNVSCNGIKKVLLPLSMGGDKDYLLATEILAPTNDSSIQMVKDNFITKNQYIHPSVAYSATAINGFNYFAFISNYPREYPSYEDEDLLCSVDGLNWSRVLPYGQAEVGAPQLPPNAFNVSVDNGRENAFVPIQSTGTIIMNGASFTIGRSLKHDPEIIIKDGYVYLYNAYNFYEVSGATYDSAKFHRFIVVFRSNNIRDWEICRTDGSTISATSSNILEIFTQSIVDGKNNYIRYFNWSVNPIAIADSNLQIVHDSIANVWYAYMKDYGNYTNSNIGVKRYTGTSHLSFDWSTPVYCSSNKSTFKQEHPSIIFTDGKYYYINGFVIHESTDGLNFTELTYFPIPCLPGFEYKTGVCIGASGNVFIFNSCIPRSYNKPTLLVPYLQTNDVCTAIFKLSSFAAIIDYAKNGRNFTSIAATITIYPKTGNAKVFNKTITTPNADWSAIELCQYDFQGGEDVSVIVSASAEGSGIVQFANVLIA